MARSERPEEQPPGSPERPLQKQSPAPARHFRSDRFEPATCSGFRKAADALGCRKGPCLVDIKVSVDATHQRVPMSLDSSRHAFS